MLLHQDLELQFIVVTLEIVKKTLIKTIKSQHHTFLALKEHKSLSLQV